MHHCTFPHPEHLIKLTDKQHKLPKKIIKKMRDECMTRYGVLMPASYHGQGMFTHKEDEADGIHIWASSSAERSV